MRLSRNSISVKLLGLFLGMAVVIAVLGIYGYVLLTRSGAKLIDAYDRPLMAVNYARSANLDFSQIELKVLQRKTAKPDERVAIDRAIDGLLLGLMSDLAVADERSTEIDEHREIDWIKGILDGWTAARKAGDDDKMHSLAKNIDEGFELLIGYYADHTFAYRQAATDSVSLYRVFIGTGVVGSLLLVFFAALFLNRQIARPLAHAALAADRVAAGEFEAQLPVGASDEIGTLLRSLAAMQGNIRARIEKEKARASSAEGRLAEALESSQEGMMLVGPDDRVITVNSRLRSYFPDSLNNLVAGASYRALVSRLGSMFEDKFEPGTFDGMSASTREHRLGDGRWVRV